MKRETIFSPEKDYRYTLWREWQGFSQCQKRFVMFIGLNPSTADEERNDHTVSCCIRFARALGFDALCMGNLFAFRSTNPNVMKRRENPVGDDNLFHLIECGLKAEIVVVAWGAAGAFGNQDLSVWEALSQKGIKLFHLGLTKNGFPKHTSRLRADAKLEPFKPKRDARFDKWKASILK